MQISQPRTLVVIGGGMAGLGSVWGLRKDNNSLLANGIKVNNNNKSLDIKILEKSTKIGGRVTSNTRHGFIYDHGANYFNFDGLANPSYIENIIKKELPTQDLTQILKGLYLFDKQSKIYPPPKGDNSLKFSYKQGIMQLPSLLLESLLQQEHNQKDNSSTSPPSQDTLEIRFESQVQSLEYIPSEKQWKINYLDKKPQSTGNTLTTIHSDFIVLTAPAPQIADLFQKSTYQHSTQIIQQFRECGYKKQLSVVIALNDDKGGYDQQYSALLNDDRQHDIAWIQFEHHKQGHIPNGKSMLICQMSEGFSERTYEQKDEDIVKMVKASLNGLLPGINLIDSNVAFAWVKRWRYALPKQQAVDEQMLKQYQDDNLFFAGDFLIGKGRVLQAFEKGLILAKDIKAKL